MQWINPRGPQSHKDAKNRNKISDMDGKKVEIKSSLHSGLDYKDCRGNDLTKYGRRGWVSCRIHRHRS